MALLALPGTSNALAEDRFALVLGNSNYQDVSALPNPAKDAKAVKAMLEEANFEADSALNLGQSNMLGAVRDFAGKLADKGKDSVALIYFAGHGIQVDGENYLIPVDAKITQAEDVPLEAVRLADVMNLMSAVPSKTRIVILDACRNAGSQFRRLAHALLQNCADDRRRRRALFDAQRHLALGEMASRPSPDPQQERRFTRHLQLCRLCPLPHYRRVGGHQRVRCRGLRGHDQGGQ